MSKANDCPFPQAEEASRLINIQGEIPGTPSVKSDWSPRSRRTQGPPPFRAIDPRDPSVSICVYFPAHCQQLSESPARRQPMTHLPSSSRRIHPILILPKFAANEFFWIFWVLWVFWVFWVLGSGFWVPGFWVLGSGFWVLGSGFWVLGSGFWVIWGSNYLHPFFLNRPLTVAFL